MTNDLLIILTKPYKIKMELDELSLQIEDLESKLLPSGIRYDKDSVQTSPEDPMLKTLTVVADLKNMYSKKLNLYTAAQMDTVRLINTLEKPEERLVLKHKYIEGMEYSEIAHKMGYSEEWVYKTRRSAIDYLEGLIKTVQ